MRHTIRTTCLRLFFTGTVVGLIVGLGCAGPRAQKKQLPPPFAATLKPVADLNGPAAGYPDSDKALADALSVQQVSTSQPAIPTRPLNILALSGGGQYGALAAGLLVGWTARGDRPNFDVATGISSGALIAAMAFLGPKYDCQLQRVFTTLEQRDLFRYRPALYLIRYRSLATSDPLKRQIEQVIDDEYIADLQAAHATGRRLFVGTMELRSRRLVVWDVGALACSNVPNPGDLVRRVILASSSISALVPPVEFNVEVNGQCSVEQHADAGGVSQVFVRFGPDHPRYGSAGPNGRWLAGSNLYLIAGGKLYADPLPTDPGFVGRATSNVSASLYALYRAELNKLFALCTVSGMSFHLLSVPQEMKTALKSMSFDPVAMRGLFDLGYGYGLNGGPWRRTPPGAEPGEEEKPRAGLRFQQSE